MSARYKDICYEKTNGVATVTLDRPEVYNAFRDETVLEMVEAFNDAAGDADIGVIVLTGAGGNFCTGGDVGWESEFTPAAGRKLMRKMAALAAAIRQNEKPVIAAVAGYCIGGGNELNMLCDLTVAAESAKFGQVGPKMGSIPVWWGTQLLPLSVGDKRAREIVFLCRRYAAREALAMGWVNRVVPDSELTEAIREWCDEILAKSPQALRVAKTSLNFISDMLHPSVHHGSLLLSMVHGTEEFKEGTSAFFEKRRPNFEAFRREGF